MPSVLFVCTANQFRSPLAAAGLRDFVDKENPPEEWMVHSAGTWTKPGLPASTIAVQIARRLGLRGLEDHVTRQVDRELLEQSDLILVMERSHLEAIKSEFRSDAGRLKLLSQIVDGNQYDVPDPNQQTGDPDEVASQLVTMVQRGGSRILQLARDLHGDRQTLHRDHT